MKICGKTALVTGANRGIGEGIVKALLERGATKVYAAARDVSKLPDFGDARVEPIAIDINNGTQIANAAEIANDVDLLVNNAGVAAFASLVDGERKLIERDMNTNYYGTLDMVRAFVPVLEKRPEGAIVNVVTIAAFVNFPMVGGYSASKAALFSLSQGIRIELAPKGISVHTVNPGPIDTAMAEELPMEKTSVAEAARRIVDGIENDEADIFPDDTSSHMFSVWKQDYRELEGMVAQM